MKTVLQILQWLRPRERWVLKSPQHLEQLGPLLRTFPDATVVVTHRDPVAVVQSTITMTCYGARTAYRTTRPEWYRDDWTDRIGTLLDTSLRDRHLLPEDRTVDVFFDQYMADEMGTLERVYDWPASRSPSEARAEIAEYQAAHPRGKEGRVAYDLRRDFAVDARRGPGAFRLLPRPLPGPGWRSDAHSRAGGPTSSTSVRAGSSCTPVYDDPAHPVTDGLYRSGGATACLHVGDRQGAGDRQHGHGLSRRRTTSGSSTPSVPGPPTTSSPPRPMSTTSAVSTSSGTRAPSTWPRPTISSARLTTRGSGSAHADGRHLVRRARAPSPRDRRREPGRSHAPVQARARPHLRRLSELVRRRCASSSCTRGGDHRQLRSSGCPNRRTASDQQSARAALPHFPNLNTLRGDRYRFVEPYLKAATAWLRCGPPCPGHRTPRTDRRRRSSSTLPWPASTMPSTTSTRRRSRPSTPVRTWRPSCRRCAAPGATGGPGLRQRRLGGADPLGELRGLVPTCGRPPSSTPTAPGAPWPS